MSPTIAELIAAWAPFIVLIAAMGLFMRLTGARARAPSGLTMIALYEQHLDELKRQATALERIAQALEQRGS